MASENQADKARQQNARDLMRRGAHAVGVEPGAQHGRSGWVVVAHVAPGATVDLPPSLSYEHGDSSIKVPLVTLHSEPFKPE